MKKAIVLIFVLTGLTFQSCKKNFTCECITTQGGTVTSYVSTTITDTKKKAKSECESGTGSSSVSGFTTAVSCEIK